jgi:hypothetical protein
MELEFPDICLFRNNDFCLRLTSASADCLSVVQVTSLCGRVWIRAYCSVDVKSLFGGGGDRLKPLESEKKYQEGIHKAWVYLNIY